jgi:hypothetical protein
MIVGIKNISELTPENYSLSQNYPNPFNQSTMFNFQCSMPGNVRISLYDIAGREVALLVNEVLQPGTYQVRFDAENLTSGVYFYRLQAGNFTETKRMLMTR